MDDELKEAPADETASCPGCGGEHAPELSAKIFKLGSTRKRRSRRQCRHCSRTFTVTIDAPEDPE